MSRIVVLFSTIHRCLEVPRVHAVLMGLLTWFIGAAALWYWLPYQPRFTFPGTEDGIVAGFSADGKILATAILSPWSDEGHVQFWDLDTSEEIGSCPINGRLPELQISTDRKVLIIERESPNDKSAVSIIDIASSRKLVSIQLRASRLDLGYLTPNGRTFVFRELGDEKVTFWDIPSGQQRLILNCHPLCFSPDGELFVSSESPEELRVRSMETGHIKALIPYTKSIQALDFG